MNKYRPALLEWLEKMFEHSIKKKWYETYHAFDVHGVILQPDYRKNNKKIIINYYPYAKETLQFLTKNRPDMILFLHTSSYQNEIESYMNQFEKDNIFFKYVNENPEISEANGCYGCYDKKPYFNSYWEDKAGFRPELDWLPIYNYFVNTKYKPDPSWSFKTVETYHNNENVDMVTLNRPRVVCEGVESDTWESYTNEEKVIKYFEALFGDKLSLTKAISSEEFKSFFEWNKLSSEFVINTLKNHLKIIK